MTNNWEMTETLAHGYSPESTQQELSYDYLHNVVKVIFIFFLQSCAMDLGNLSIRSIELVDFAALGKNGLVFPLTLSLPKRTDTV